MPGLYYYSEEFKEAATVEGLSAALAPFGFRCLSLENCSGNNGIADVSIEVMDSSI